MSSGRKAVKENTLERLISADFNRMQAFIAGWANEALRRQVLAPVDDSLAVGTTFFNAGPLTAAFDVLAPAAPDYAGVLNGLMVIVPAAATYLLVSSGMLLVVDPEGQVGSSEPPPGGALNPDDGPGPSRLVYSDGVTVAGALAWTPNPGPGVRVDVVECQRANVVAETDNRDIFDPSTGLFTPQAVTKVTVGDLTYRIRQGAAGGGLPAPALGWVPLAVIASAAGAANLDAAVVWDVRPLLSDLSKPFAQVRSIYPTVDRYRMVCENKSNVAQLRLSGESQGTYLGWRMGGIFAEAGGTSYVDLANATFYQAAGFAAAPNLPYYVYSLWPGGYVRWVRYYATPVAGVGGRVPGPFRGIITVSQIPPLNGQPTAPVAVPPAWGLSVSTVFGQMLAAGVINSVGAMNGFVADGDLEHLEDTSLPVVAPSSIVNLGGGSFDVNYTFTPGVHFPAGARRIRVEATATITGLAAGQYLYLEEHAQLVTVAGSLQLAEVGKRQHSVCQPDALASLPYTATWDLPVAADGISAPPALKLQWNLTQLVSNGGAAGTVAGSVLRVTGWDL